MTKRILVLFLTICALLVAAPALAQETVTTRSGLRDGAWTKASVLAASSPLMFGLWINAHETSHLVWAKFFHQKVDGFKPYPHYQTFANGQRIFYFGKVDFHQPTTTTPLQQMLINGAPFMTDIAMFTATDLALSLQHTDGSWAEAFAWAVGMVTPLVDYANGVNAVRHSYSDAAGVRDQLHLKTWEVLAAGHAVTAIGLWRVLDQGYRIFWKQGERPATKLEATNWHVAPTFAPNYGGLAVAGTF
jgi:hypothetical protein